MVSYPIRVLVVDDSAYLRKVVSEMLNASPFLVVVGTAHNGIDALDKVQTLQPDVITLDLYMPELDGIGFLRELCCRQKLPVVVVSIATEDGAAVMAALEAGAVDFVRKPTALASEKMYDIAQDLVEKVRTAALIAPERLPEPSTSVPNVPVLPEIPPGRFDVVVIGISTGGPQALRSLLPRFPAQFPAALAIVQHMPPGYTGPFAERLNEISELKVLEATEGMEMRPGRVILAQAGYHLILKGGPVTGVRAHLSSLPAEPLHRPSVDVLFRSAAETYGARALGIVMTGMGNDGTEGAAWIKSQGGTVIVEDESSCVVFGMPRSVIEAGLADQTVPLSRMAETISEVMQ